MQQDQVLEQGSSGAVLDAPQEFTGGLLGGGAKTAEEAVNRRLPERELKMPRKIGAGPHVSMGRGVKKQWATGGKVAHATHGTRSHGQTKGRTDRAQADLARQARSSPRDALHYREDFGTSLTDETHAAAVQSEKDFGKYTQDVRCAISQERSNVAQGRQQTEQEWKGAQSQLTSQRDSAISQLNSERDKAMRSLGSPKSMQDAYRDAYKNDFHPMWVVTGTLSNPGKVQAMYRAPVQYLQAVFPEMVQGGYQVVNNRVYIGNRGQEAHDLGRRMESEAKNAFYKEAGPQVQQYNAQIIRAQSEVNTQYNTAVGSVNQQYSQTFNTVQKQYSNAMAQLGQREGAALGREQGLGLEIQNRQDELKEIRQSYRDRLSRIDEAISSNVERTAGSRSEQQEIRQLDPRRPGLQQQG